MAGTLLVLLILSLAANGFQYHKWHTYRTQPAGTHSYTGMMPAIKPKR